METGERDLLSLWKIISKYIMPIEEALYIFRAKQLELTLETSVLSKKRSGEGRRRERN